MVRVQLAFATAVALVLMGAAAAATQLPDRTLSAPAVEGHSTFVTLDIVPRAPPPAFGLAVCKHTVDVPEALLHLLEILGSCRDELGAVFATPDAFPPPAREASLTSTGRERVHADPFGHAWTTTEYTYPIPGGEGVTYVVETGATSVHPETEEAYNFVLALPPLPNGVAWKSIFVTPGNAP